MAGGDEYLGGGSDVRKVGAALLFVGAGTNVYDAFSAVMSSPWSTEKFTDDPEQERMARQYVTHALVISGGYAAIGAWLARSWWPVFGAAGIAAYMLWLYNRALVRARSPQGMTAATAPAGAGAGNQSAGPVMGAMAA